MQNSDLNKINKIVSGVCKVKPEELRSKCRKQKFVFARMIFASVCKQKKISQIEIARYLGISQPAINHYVYSILNEIKVNSSFKKMYDEVLLIVNET